MARNPAVNSGQLSEAEVKARADSAFELRKLWRSILQEAYELALPWRNPYTGNKKSPKLMNALYESTAPVATVRLANKLLQEFTPPGEHWVGLKAGPLLEIELEGRQADLDMLNKKLEKVVRMISMPLSSPAFTSAIHECYLDLVVSGLAVMLAQENNGNDLEPMLYQNVPQNEVAIVDGPMGNVEELYRKRENFKARMVSRTWQDAALPDALQKLVDDKKKDAEITLLEVTYYAHDQKKPWYYEVFWDNAGKPERLVSRTYHDNPWIVFRWMKLPGIPYGPGPVLLALHDIRTANKVMEMILKNAALALAGMYLVRDDGVVNMDTVQITQGGMITVAATGGSAGASIAPLQTGRNFDVGQIVLDDLRMQIKKTLLDFGLPEFSGKSFSPTEIMQRTKEMTQDYGGAIGRLINDVIVPIVRITANTMARSGKIPELNVNQYIVKVHVNSPMARAQQFQDLQRVVQWLETSKALAGEQVTMMGTKLEEFPAWSGRLVGVPTDLIRTDVERQQMEQQIAQIVAAQQMQAAGASSVQAM